MNALQILNQYIEQHPEYWEYQNEAQEVERLRKLCEKEVTPSQFIEIQKNAQLDICNF